MIGGPVAAALLACAVGLALSPLPRPTLGRSLLLFLGAAAVAALVAWQAGPLPPSVERVGLAVTVASTLLAVGRPGLLGLASPRLLAIAAPMAGALAGALAPGAGPLSWAAPAAALIALPGHWAATTGRLVAVRVVASWVLAMTVLAVVLTLAPITAGYEQDHRE